jgi:hypothetical protein
MLPIGDLRYTRRAILRLMIADLCATGLCRRHLAKFGMFDVARRGLGWRMW